MPPDPKTKNGAENEVNTGIDEIFSADEDAYAGYEAPDDRGGDDLPDTGGAPAGDHPGDTRTETVTEEPELPGVPHHEQRAPQPQYDAENPRGYTRVGTLFADKDGNIVSRDGRVMAAKGEPARHWFNMSKQVAQIPALHQQLEAVNRQIQDNHAIVMSAKELADLPGKLGISREDYNT